MPAERAFHDAIRTAYGVDSRFVEAVPVTEIYKGKTIWSRIVHVFDLIDCPNADRAYVWTELEDGVTARQTIKLMLRAGPVQSPLDAVRATIVQDHAASQGGADAV